MGIEEESAPPIAAPYLFPAYPNPFKSCTSLQLTVPNPVMVLAVVYDITGRQVASLVKEVFPAGEHLLSWNGRNNHGELLGHGIYFVAVTIGGHQVVQRIVRLR